MTTKTILVTGGGPGIGLSIVKAILEQGWHAVVADVHPDNLARARGTLSNHHALVHFQQLDVADEEAVVEAITKCESDVGPVAGLVNSGGIGSDVHCLDTTTALSCRTCP